ncbi:MAG: hypothetical protein WKF87_06590 [Chryseolinea sp.]
METITIKLPTIDQINFELIAEYESMPVKGNAMASGDEKVDKKVEDSIIRRINNGNVWAWAAVELKGTYKGLEFSDHLGCCSYKSKADFKQPGGYYDDMKQVVYDGIIEALKQFSA